MSSVGHGFYQSAPVVHFLSPVMFSKFLIHNLNLNRGLNRRNIGTDLQRIERFQKSTDSQKSRRIRDREGDPPPVRNTELHLQSTCIASRKTILVKRATPGRRHTNFTQNRPEVYCTLSDPRTDLKRRARMIPESQSMRDPVLNVLISRMFGRSAAQATFVPPQKISPFQASNNASSPDTQIIRQSSRISQLIKRYLRRSFSTINRDHIGSSINFLPPPVPHHISKKTANKKPHIRRIKKALPRAPLRSETHLRRGSISHPSTQFSNLSVDQLLRGPSLIPASEVILRKNLQGVSQGAVPQPNLDDEKLPEIIPSIGPASYDLNSNSMSKLAEETKKSASSGLFTTILGAISKMLTQKTTGDFTPETSGTKTANSSEIPGRSDYMESSKSVDTTFNYLERLQELSNYPPPTGTVDRTNHRHTGRVKRFNNLFTYPDGSIRTLGVIPRLPSFESVLTDVAPLEEQPLIARLSHGLDRVLFNQSVHWLQDPHSGVFNFPPDLQTLPSVTDFAFERLSKYKHSSEDHRMLHLAAQHSKSFVGSTSSLTRILSHIYFLLSEDKLIDISTLSMAFAEQSRKFTPGMRAPALITIHRRPLPNNDQTNNRHVYAVESLRSELHDRQMEWNVLLWLGTMMERLLTLPPEQFDGLLRKNPVSHSFQEKAETYRYAKSRKFIMRSQLDCQDSRLPGTGVFDLKSRAVLPIRIDQLNIHEHTGYLIQHATGLIQSFEREYYDLIRSAFLKFNFQARIGNMDGIFVAYHNTARLFGFQYVPVTEMEDRLYGPGHPERGTHIFQKCVGLMEAIMERIVECFPGHSLSCTLNTKEDSNQLIVWVVPVDYNAYPIPIEQFTVTVGHVVNRIQVNGKIAIERAHQNWTVTYSITRSFQSQEEIWASLKKCQQAGEFPVILPEGVSVDDARTRLGSVNWGAGSGFKWDPEDRVSVKSPDEELTAQEPVGIQELQGLKLTAKSGGLVTRLRKIARRGATRLEHEKTTTEKPQILWGRDPDVIDNSASSQFNVPSNSKSNFEASEDPSASANEDQTR